MTKKYSEKINNELENALNEMNDNDLINLYVENYACDNIYKLDKWLGYVSTSEAIKRASEGSINLNDKYINLGDYYYDTVTANNVIDLLDWETWLSILDDVCDSKNIDLYDDDTDSNDILEMVSRL